MLKNTIKNRNRIHYLLGRIQGTLKLNKLKMLDDNRTLEEIRISIQDYKAKIKEHTKKGEKSGH